MELFDDKMCFGCGADNPIGLKLKFAVEGETAYSEFTPTELYQGYAGIVHGGIMTTLLDEVAGRLLFDLGISAVTAQIEVKFKKPARIGERIKVFGEIKEKKGKLIITYSKATDVDGEILAEAKAKFIVP